MADPFIKENCDVYNNSGTEQITCELMKQLFCANSGTGDSTSYSKDCLEWCGCNGRTCTEKATNSNCSDLDTGELRTCSCQTDEDSLNICNNDGFCIDSVGELVGGLVVKTYNNYLKII